MILDVKRLADFSIQKDIRIISFDVFDTLLIRKTDPPEDVKRIVALNIEKSGLIRCSSTEFSYLRDRFESELRQQAASEGHDPECSIEEIFRLIVDHLGEHPAILKDLIDVEKLVEKTFITSMPGIHSILERLSNTHKLIAISDTYLPGWMLKEILHSHGLLDFFSDVYASSDYKLSKGSSRLFKKILEKENIKNTHFLHIGDNFFSDYFVPRNIGIRAMLLYDKWNLKRKGILRTLAKREKSSPFWKGYSFIHRIISTERPSSVDESLCYWWGKTVMGPLVSNFIHILTIHCNRSQLERIFFIAREGFLLRKLYNLFSENLYNGQLPYSAYMFASRYTSFVSSMKSLGERELNYATSGSYIKIKDALYRLGIEDIEGIKGLLEKYGVHPEDVPDINKLKESLRVLFNDPEFADIILTSSSKMRNLFEQYLKRINFFDPKKNIAFVDVGWNGTIQDCIEYAFQGNPNMAQISGYYLALKPPIDVIQTQKQGLMCDYRQFCPEELTITVFREALEFSCRAYHGTTIGYKSLSDGKVIPVVRNNTPDRTMEKMGYPHIFLIQKGILDFAKEYIEMVKISNVDPFHIKYATIKLYDTILSFPSAQHIAAIEQVINTDDFGSGNIRPIVRAFRHNDLFSPKRFIQMIVETPWREASFLQSNMPLLNRLYNIVKRLEFWRRRKGHPINDKITF